MIIEQKDIQKKGGKCARYPTSCIVRDLIAAARLFKPFKPLVILDLTYGEGRFYVSFKNKVKLYGFDILRLEHVVKPYRFYNKSCEKWKRYRDEINNVDLVVVDPPFMPYRRGNEKRKHYAANGAAITCTNEALKAAEYYNAPVLIHYPFKITPYQWKILEEVWFMGYAAVKLKPTWFGIITKDHKQGVVNEN